MTRIEEVDNAVKTIEGAVSRIIGARRCYHEAQASSSAPFVERRYAEVELRRAHEEFSSCLESVEILLAAYKDCCIELRWQRRASSSERTQTSCYEGRGATRRSSGE